MKYYDAYDQITNRWLCCVKAPGWGEALTKASQLSGIGINFIQLEERKESNE